MRAPRFARRLTRLVIASAVIAIAVPSQVLGSGDHGERDDHDRHKPASYVTTSVPYVVSTGAVAGVEIKPLINSGETAFGTLFEGIPDGIGVVPGGWHRRYVDLYVTHEQSPVPFGGFADYQNSSVSRVRVDTKTQTIIGMDVALSPDEGFIRFCSATMVGPAQGFRHYTFLVNEESNDPLNVPAGAVYGADPAYGGADIRQAGYSAYLDTRTDKVGLLSSAGRLNHENNVVVPGWWGRQVVSLTGDDTFTFPSTPARPNLSQMYMTLSRNSSAFLKDQSTLWAFRVTSTGGAAIDPTDAHNGANDYFDIGLGDNWKGEFIPVPDSIARGTTGDLPQDALEDWSNANNVFQFVRIEDIAYDPDAPRTVYFTDTGNTRLLDPGTGRLYRASSGGAGSNGRIFKMVFNKKDPTKVDSFSILADADVLGMRHPDNVAVSHRSVMIQEDVEGDATIWMYSLSAGTWTKVAKATQPKAETSGIIDVSNWFGKGWWALDVQSHVNTSETPGLVYGGPGPSNGVTYTGRREDGQLLLMYVPGS